MSPILHIQLPAPQSLNQESTLIQHLHVSKMSSFTIFACLLATFAFTTTVVQVQGCTQPEITVYESEGYAGDYVEIARRFDSRVNVPDVSVYGLKNYRTYHCQEGVWMSYPQPNYTGFPYIWEDDSCSGSGISLDGLASIHVIGDPSNFTTPTLNTFPGYHYQGEQATHYERVRQFETNFQSLVLLGSTSVELFTGTGQTGLSICVRAHLGQVYDYSELVNPTNPKNRRGTYIYDLERTLGLPVGSIKSFAFGCRNLGEGSKDMIIPPPSGSGSVVRDRAANSVDFLAQRRRQ